MARISAQTLAEYLQQLWDVKGTDLLITAGSPPLMRVDERMRPIEGEPILHPTDTEKLILGLLSESQAAELAGQKELDFSFSWHGQARFRGNAFHQRDSLALSLRLIPFKIPTLEELGAPPVVNSLIEQPSGLIIVTGPTGCGKSTTLASMVDVIARTRASHILTIEDPIEYLHHHQTGAVNQREVGTDTESFGRALRSALREDPDVLMVGEMRDMESVEITLMMAETGHLVFATLHTNDSAQALDRLVGVFPADRHDQVRLQLSSCLNGVIYQRLVPMTQGGLVAAFEVLVGSPAIRNLVREGKTRQLRNLLTMGQAEGMQTLEAALSKLVLDGLVDYEQAVGRSLYPKEVLKPLPPSAAQPDINLVAAS